jgi:hypothetical protein
MLLIEYLSADIKVRSTILSELPVREAAYYANCANAD